MDRRLISGFLPVLIYFIEPILSSDSCSRSYTFDDGGWFTDEDKLIAQAGPCSIPVRDVTLSQEEFLSQYAFTQPVIIKGLTQHQAFQDVCRKEAMLKKFGDKIIRLSSANTYSYLKYDVSLRYYVDSIMKPQTLDMMGNETFYWFGDNNHTEWEELFSLYKPPPYRLPGLTGVYSFGLAGAGTGVPFHFHGPGFGEVVFGRKRWFLYPPEEKPTFDPNKTTLHWMMEDYPKLSEENKPMECTINQGELIYFPDRWWHGTLNIDTSVFISTFLGPS
ncbi:jmjC domain-containing protein 8-like [Liolophura sinensis]|uniref:jmjC domain-containing protein 8-like n=1 Tax=Liolophura sinensis TaxID=3198878 RepID=UPI003159896B